MERLVAEFGADPALRPVRILLATDTASEGLDLQRHCRLMVHAEIPFNPNRLEQRNGRIDRHGQPSPSVEIYHFVGSNVDAAPGSLDADLEFLSRAARKVEQIRADLGAAGAVLAREVENAMLGRSADVDRPSPTSGSRATVRRLDRELRERIDELKARIDLSIEELGITPRALARAVELGLELGRQAPLRPIGLAATERAPRAEAFEVPELTRSWASAAADLYDEIRDRRTDVDFDEGIVSVRRSVLIVDGERREKPPKTRLSQRSNFLPDFVLEELLRHWAAQRERRIAHGLGKDPDCYIFDDLAGRPWHPETFSWWVNTLCDRAGVPAVTLQALRRSFGTFLLMAGNDSRTVSQLLGHSNTVTTERAYLGTVPKLKRSAIAGLDDEVGDIFRDTA